jgi:perosamine synthetase
MADAAIAEAPAEVAARICRAVESVLGPAEQFIPLHEPEFTGSERAYVNECVETGWVSTAGAFVGKFEQMVADFLGVKHAVAVVNGTAALHLSLQLAGVKPGEEVIAPTLSFAATAAAIAHCGAIPHFVDVDRRTLGMDALTLEAYLREVAERRGSGTVNRGTGRRIAAIVPMHTFGIPADMDPLLAVAETWDIPVVEDAAESLGSTYKGVHCGNFGRIAATSFNGNKIVTTGGGGMILTNDAELAKRAKHLSTTAKLPHAWLYEHDEVGYNYRLPNINAALGCGQLERLPALLERKRRVATAYQRCFSQIPSIEFVREYEGSTSNYWLNAILVPDDERNAVRDAVLETLNKANYMARPAWTLLHKLAPYASAPRMSAMPVAAEIERRLVNLPSSPQLADRLTG